MFNDGITTILLYYYVKVLLILNKPNRTKEKVIYPTFSVNTI